MTVTILLEQPCSNANSPNIVTSCQQLVPNLFQQLRTSSVNTTCQQLENGFVTNLFQVCFHWSVLFTRVEH